MRPKKGVGRHFRGLNTAAVAPPPLRVKRVFEVRRRVRFEVEFEVGFGIGVARE